VGIRVGLFVGSPVGVEVTRGSDSDEDGSQLVTHIPKCFKLLKPPPILVEYKTSVERTASSFSHLQSVVSVADCRFTPLMA